MAEFTIRPMVPEDHPEVLECWTAAGLNHRPEGRDSYAEFERQIGWDCTMYYVAVIDDQVVGVILGTHDSRKGWLNRLAVYPDHQRKGIALALCHKVEQDCEDIGIEITAAQIEGDNPVSDALMNKLGYYRHTDMVYLTKRKGEWV